jgi:porin
MKRLLRYFFGIGLVLAFVSTALLAFADEPAPNNPYSGNFLTRSTLTGDWGGARNDLAKKGVTFDMNVTQVTQGVVDGGKSSVWENGGRGNLTLKMDTGKMGLWPGGFLTAEFEGNWGRAVNGYTGALTPVNNNQIYPAPATEGVALPALNFTQFLSEHVGLMFGKFDTASTGDHNEFAHGKGDVQFMNLAFSVNPVLLMTMPYSTLGAGIIILPTKDPKAVVVNVLVASSTGQATTSGFSELNANNMSLAAEAKVRTNFFGLTGHQLIGYSYSNKEFTSLDQRLQILIRENEAEKTKGSWAFYYNFDQYVYEPVKGSGKGIGVFGRFGASDGNPNPVNYFISAGVGGKGMIPGRPFDRFGLGYYYIDVQNPTFQGPLSTRNFLRDEQGLEVFYNIAVTPWAQLTPNIQVIKGAQKYTIDNGRENIHTDTVLGLRFNLVL